MSYPVDVIVVGTGALGASTGYHLAARGATVLFVDQFDPGSQTSPQAAGLSTTITRDKQLAAVAMQSAERLRSMSVDLDFEVNIVRSGTIRVTRDPAFVDNVREETQQAGRQGIVATTIDADEARRLAPFLDPGAVLEMTYAPDELYLPDPGEVARAYLHAARGLGAVVLSNTRVEDFVLGMGRVNAVKSTGGRLTGGAVVLCANAGNGRLARLLGCTLRTVPMRHQLAITAPLACVTPTQPQVKIVDGNVYVRPHGDRVLIGGFEPTPLLFAHDDACQLDMRSMPLNPEPLQELLRGVADVLPAVAAAPLEEVRGGVVSMTPDGRYIMDRIAGISNAWLLGGDNAGGNTRSPVLGQLMADWILDGRPPVDLSAFALSRFDSLDAAVVRSRAREQYVNMIALD